MNRNWHNQKANVEILYFLFIFAFQDGGLLLKCLISLVTFQVTKRTCKAHAHVIDKT